MITTAATKVKFLLMLYIHHRLAAALFRARFMQGPKMMEEPGAQRTSPRNMLPQRARQKDGKR